MKFKEIKTKVLFRCHGLGAIMTEPQGKTNLQKYEDAVSSLAKLNEKNNELTERYKLCQKEVNELEPQKENEVAERKNRKSPAEKYRLAVAKRDKVQGEISEATAKTLELEMKISDLEAVKDVPTLSATCKKYLKTMAIEIRYKRKKRMENKYTRKGVAVEDANIELYSDATGEAFENNKVRKENDFFTGECDIEVLGVDESVDEVKDMKSRYDVDSFFDHLEEEATAKDRFQLLGYCDLWDAKKASVVNVLGNNDFSLIMDEIRRETYATKSENLEGFEAPLHRIIEIAKDNIFETQAFEDFLFTQISLDDFTSLNDGTHPNKEAQEMFNSFVEIPIEERVIETTVERDNEEIERIKRRIEDCRLYLAQTFNIIHDANG